MKQQTLIDVGNHGLRVRQRYRGLSEFTVIQKFWPSSSYEVSIAPDEIRWLANVLAARADELEARSAKAANKRKARVK